MNAQVRDKPVIEMPVRVSGRITSLKVVRADGSVKHDLAFDNLVTDAGLDAMSSGAISDLSDYLAVGTGTNTPAVTDTGLQTEVARTNSLSGSASRDTSGASPWWGSYSRTWVFNPGAFSGQSLAEVGLFNTSAPGTCFSRALIKDAGGTPTPIVVLADEYLYVTWELRKYVGNEGDVTGTINISGTDYDYTIRATRVNQSDSGNQFWAADTGAYCGYAFAYETQTPVAIDSTIGGTASGSTTESLAAYGAGNKYRDLTVTWTPPNANFATGIGCVALAYYDAGAYAGWACFFDTDKIPKDSDNELTLTFRVSWDRV